MKPLKIIFIVGPTAVGKSDAAFLLAKEIDGEIIACDAMQVYKEISILSNKPSKEAVRKVRHHALGCVSVTREYDVVSFQKKVKTAISQIHKRKKIPIIVGGSGFYMKILLDGIFKGKAASESFRLSLEKRIEAEGLESLYEELKKVDSASALKIHTHDKKRIMRALEVFSLHQKPISELQKKRKGLWGKYDIRIFGLNYERAKLYQRINERVEKMFEDGAVLEIQKLASKKISKTAHTIIGVKEIQDFLKGNLSLAETKSLIQQKTRRYAKRQLTWFRQEKRLQWINIEDHDTSLSIASRIQKELEL